MLFLSALLQVLSYPPFDLGWLAWVAHLPWLAALQKTPSPRLAFARSYLIGLLFFAGTIGWVGHVTVIGAILLIAYLALFFGAWGWLAHCVIARPPPSPSLRGPEGAEAIPLRAREIASSSAKDRWRTPRNDALWILPAAWVALEYLRSTLLSGFGWNLLAHTQWDWILAIQIADTTGVWGVSFLVALVNVALFVWVKGEGSRVKGLGVAALCILGALGYGFFRLHPFPTPYTLHPSPSFKIALLQGNILQAEKWDEAFAEAIWKRYEELTAQAVRMQPDLVVWPETALPGFLQEPAIAVRLRRIIRSAGVPFLVGVPVSDTAVSDTGVYNSAVLLDPQGEELKRYDKIHLVPFGEFIPFRPILGWIQRMVPVGDFAPGTGRTVFGITRDLKPVRRTVPVRRTELRFSVLICFEDLFPELARGFVREGAQGLFVITNDAWFKQSAASLQHLQASVFRAVENRVWVARAANTGWTGVVDPCGRRLPAPGQAERFKPALATARLPILGTRTSSCPPSRYVRWGDWFPAGCLILTGIAFFPRRRPL